VVKQPLNSRATFGPGVLPQSPMTVDVGAEMTALEQLLSEMGYLGCRSWICRCVMGGSEAVRRRRGSGASIEEGFSSGNWGRGFEVSFVMAVVDWVRVGEGRPDGGGASGVRLALSARDKRFR